MTKREKAIYNELLAKATPRVKTINFIPEKLGVSNLSTYLKGGNEEETKEKLFLAFHEAYHYAHQHNIDPTTIIVATNGGEAENWNLARSAMCFRATRLETRKEMENHIACEANRVYRAELDEKRKVNRAKKELEKARAKVAELEAKANS